LERAQSFSSFLRLSSSSFRHRWRGQIDLNLSDPRVIDISSGDKFILTSLLPWLDLTTPKRRSGQRNLFHNDDTISAIMSTSGNLNLQDEPSEVALLPPPEPEVAPPLPLELIWRRKSSHGSIADIVTAWTDADLASICKT
jgi:hypothetical protein